MEIVAIPLQSSCEKIELWHKAGSGFGTAETTVHRSRTRYANKRTVQERKKTVRCIDRIWYTERSILLHRDSGVWDVGWWRWANSIVGVWILGFHICEAQAQKGRVPCCYPRVSHSLFLLPLLCQNGQSNSLRCRRRYWSTLVASLEAIWAHHPLVPLRYCQHTWRCRWS